MVRLARGAARGHRGKMGRGRGLGPPPPLMARNNVMPPPIPPPRMPPPRMRPLPPPGMRSPPFVPPMPGPLPPPPPHMRPPPPRLPPVPPVPPMRRNLPFPPRPPGPMFPPHVPIPRMPPPILPPLMRGRGRLPPRGMGLRHSLRIKKLGVAPFKQRRGKKNKTVKEKPEGDFFCTTCDRGFKTDEKLEQHCSEHVTCNIDGCTVTAHKKIIEKHVLLVHESGLFNKIGNKNSPEDIAQWIAERKRNYPTKKNIEEKISQFDEMERRGERIHHNKSRFANQSKGKSDKATHNKSQPNRSTKSESQKSSSSKRNRQRANKLNLFCGETEQQDSWIGSLPHFPGTDLFPEEEEKEEDASRNENEKGFSDDEWENVTSAVAVEDEVVNTKTKPLAAVLNALCAAYNSDVEMSEDESVQGEDLNLKSKDSSGNPSGEEHLEKSVVTIGIPEVKDMYRDKNDDSGPEEVPILRQDVSLPSSNNLNVTSSFDMNKENGELNEATKKGRKRKRSHNRKPEAGKDTSDAKKQFSPQPRNFVPKRRLTLLQKLLEPEIRHERNVILQCIRYIVENNFLGIGQ